MSHGTRRLLGGRLQSRCGPPRQGSQGVVQTPADTPDLMRSSGPLTTGPRDMPGLGRCGGRLPDRFDPLES